MYPAAAPRFLNVLLRKLRGEVREKVEECSSEINATGRVLYTADAYRKDGKRFTVIADDKLTAFLELEGVTGNDGN